MTPTDRQEGTSNSTPITNRNQLTPGIVIMDDHQNSFRVERLDGDKVYCIAVGGGESKRTFNIDDLLTGNWQLQRKAA